MLVVLLLWFPVGNVMGWGQSPWLCFGQIDDQTGSDLNLHKGDRDSIWLYLCVSGGYVFPWLQITNHHFYSNIENDVSDDSFMMRMLLVPIAVKPALCVCVCSEDLNFQEKLSVFVLCCWVIFNTCNRLIHFLYELTGTQCFQWLSTDDLGPRHCVCVCLI